VEGGGNHHARLCAVHAPVHAGHAPVSKIYSQACVGHAPAYGGKMEQWLMAERSGGSPNHGGVVRVVVKLLEDDKSNFEKTKFKNVKKMSDSRPSAVEERPMILLNLDKLLWAIDGALEEASGASKEAKKGGGKRMRRVRGRRK
jgi:hypothetical protein